MHVRNKYTIRPTLYVHCISNVSSQSACQQCTRTLTGVRAGALGRRCTTLTTYKNHVLVRYVMNLRNAVLSEGNTTCYCHAQRKDWICTRFIVNCEAFRNMLISKCRVIGPSPNYLARGLPLVSCPCLLLKGAKGQIFRNDINK